MQELAVRHATKRQSSGGAAMHIMLFLTPGLENIHVFLFFVFIPVSLGELSRRSDLTNGIVISIAGDQNAH